MSPDDKCTTRSGVYKPYHCRIMKQKKKKNSTPLTMLCLDLVAKNSNAIGKNMEISVKSSSVLDHYQRSTFLSLIQIQPDTSASKFQSVGFRQAGKVEIVKVVPVINHAQVSFPNFIMKFNIISLCTLGLLIPENILNTWVFFSGINCKNDPDFPARAKFVLLFEVTCLILYPYLIKRKLQNFS